MLVLRENCCALCQESHQESWLDNEAFVVITLSYDCEIWKGVTYTNQMHFHPRCWSRATDQSYYIYNETQSLYFTEKEWVELAGKKYSTREYCYVDLGGMKYWYSNNKLHREDGPAVEHPDGTKQWYLNGERHREDDPAIKWADGTKQWYSHGKRHREDGPAIEYADGRKYWFLNGQRHRTDGPAVIHPGNPPDEYWINGRQRFNNE